VTSDGKPCATGESPVIVTNIAKRYDYLVIISTRQSTRRISVVCVLFSVALLGCGEAAAGSFTPADKQQVQQKTSDLQKSVDTLGQDLGQCAQDAVASLIGGGDTNVEKCVTKQLNTRADMAKSLDSFLAAVAPKAQGQCATELKALSGLAASAGATITKTVDAFSNGFNPATAQAIVGDVMKLIDSAKQTWTKVNTACAG